MAYATVQELADAMRTPLTAANSASFQACLDAAAVEIDYAINADTDPPDPDSALLNRVNIVRGIEWAKANDAAFGTPATATATMLTPPASFAPHSATLTPLKSTFGVA